MQPLVDQNARERIAKQNKCKCPKTRDIIGFVLLAVKLLIFFVIIRTQSGKNFKEAIDENFQLSKNLYDEALNFLENKMLEKAMEKKIESLSYAKRAYY